MLFKCTYKYIRIRLTHRLVRKLLKEFSKYIKNNNLNRVNWWLIINNYNLLKKMWRHPNKDRFQDVCPRCKFKKKTTDRYIFIANNWEIFLSDNSWYSINKWSSYRTIRNNIDDIIQLVLRNPTCCPF